jgi:formylglycine-generating enzyme required for sulfatase activity
MTNSVGMKLALIPPGEFLMGSKDSVENADEDEKPQHPVRITTPFYLGVNEVTQEEYQRVMDENPSAFSPEGKGSKQVSDLETGRFPVESVSWDDAVEFCRKLSLLAEEKAAGLVYRLPTEAEWEYACRAGTTTPFYFGDELNEQANSSGLYGKTQEDSLGRTTTVGSYPPNAFGLSDMHGNVWEWCQDWYDGDYYESSPVDNPQGPPEGLRRVIRGGCWRYAARYCRAAFRNRDEPQDRSNYVGFRVAAVPPDK